MLGTFQNCAKSSGTVAFTPISSGAPHENSSDALEKVENFDLSSAEYIDVSLRSLYAESNDMQPRRSKDPQNIKINLANGEMRYVDADGIVVNDTRLCLRRQELEEFKAILHSARLCQPILPSAREDIACAQVYKYPFAWVQYINGEKIKLGEVAGCNRSLDLCDEHRDMFNGFVAYLRNHLDNRKCL